VRILVFTLFTIFSLSACGDTQHPTYLTGKKEKSSVTVSVVDHEPEDRSLDIINSQEVRLTFSDRVQWSSVNFDNFRVEDEFGQVVHGEIKISNDDRELTYKPVRNSQDSVWEHDRTYTVISRYLKDTSGYLIAPFAWQFRTEQGEHSSGDFKAVKVHPSSRFIHPTAAEVAVEFNEEIYVPSGMSLCNTSYWANSMQLVVIQPANKDFDSASFSLNGEICVVQNSAGKYKKLRFNPGELNSIPELSYLEIRIFNSPELKGNQSLQTLEKQVVYSKGVYPSGETIWNFVGHVLF